MSLFQNANKRCCFTGHRPGKLKLSDDEVRRLLRDAIVKAIEDGYTTFISGMAEGTDILAAEEVLRIKSENPSVKLICALPFASFASRRKAVERQRFNDICSRADATYIVAKGSGYTCYDERNKWMIDRSGRVIAFFDGSPGGTKNTIDYAKNKNIEIVNVLE